MAQRKSIKERMEPFTKETSSPTSPLATSTTSGQEASLGRDRARAREDSVARQRRTEEKSKIRPKSGGSQTDMQTNQSLSRAYGLSKPETGPPASLTSPVSSPTNTSSPPPHASLTTHTHSRRITTSSTTTPLGGTSHSDSHGNGRGTGAASGRGTGAASAYAPKPPETQRPNDSFVPIRNYRKPVSYV